MLCLLVLLSLIADMTSGLLREEKVWPRLLHLLLFVTGCSSMLFAAWPYLWRDPLMHFTGSFSMFSHFDWGGTVLFKGKMEQGVLPWTYFPTWFFISNPVLWLVAGFGGLVWILIAIGRRPRAFLSNTEERNFLIYVLCFCGPILAVFFLHSIIYDDWRHLYFVYPPFVFLALYFISKLIHGRYKLVVLGACMVQLGFAVSFMVVNHPFQQVYFNELVSHDKEYLRKNYDLEYWGCGFYQGLNHLLATTKGIIKITADDAGAVPLRNNIRMLREQDKGRVEMTNEANADYFITNYRLHPNDFAYPKVEHSITALNSTIICVYKMR